MPMRDMADEKCAGFVRGEFHDAHLANKGVEEIGEYGVAAVFITADENGNMRGIRRCVE